MKPRSLAQRFDLFADCSHAPPDSAQLQNDDGFSLLETVMSLWIIGIVFIVAVGSLLEVERTYFQLTEAAAGIDDSWVLYHAMASDIRSAVRYSYTGDEIEVALQDGSTAAYRLSPWSNLIERSRNGLGVVPVAANISGLSYTAVPGTGVWVTVQQGGSGYVGNLLLVFARGSF
ncbi:MAG: PulJ/GspJ family protein [Bacilli bacterium]